MGVARGRQRTARRDRRDPERRQRRDRQDPRRRIGVPRADARRRRMRVMTRRDRQPSLLASSPLCARASGRRATFRPTVPPRPWPLASAVSDPAIRAAAQSAATRSSTPYEENAYASQRGQAAVLRLQLHRLPRQRRRRHRPGADRRPVDLRARGRRRSIARSSRDGPTACRRCAARSRPPDLAARRLRPIARAAWRRRMRRRAARSHERRIRPRIATPGRRQERRRDRRQRCATRHVPASDAVGPRSGRLQARAHRAALVADVLGRVAVWCLRDRHARSLAGAAMPPRRRDGRPSRRRPRRAVKRRRRRGASRVLILFVLLVGERLDRARGRVASAPRAPSRSR